MTTSANSDDERALAAYGAALADGVEQALPDWVVRCVVRIVRLWSPSDVVAPAIVEEAAAAGERAAQDIGRELRALLAKDIDEQAVNPLAIVRRAVRYPTEVLARAGVPAIVRDEQSERLFPDDAYDLSPASFADIDPVLTDLGLTWGAAKAHVHLSRRRSRKT